MSTKVEREKIFCKRLNKNLFLNFITLNDEQWISEQFGAEEVAKAFEPETLNENIILNLAWRLFDDEAKRAIRDCKIIEWEGLKETEILFTDPILKLRHVLSGADEIVQLLFAFGDITKKSRPDKVIQEKKKQLETGQ
jgi:hypothetical protein